MGVVVSKRQPSLHSAIQAVRTSVPASIACLYEKANGVEPEVVPALVSHTSDKLFKVVVTMTGQVPAAPSNGASHEDSTLLWPLQP